MNSEFEQIELSVSSGKQDEESGVESFGCCSRYRVCSDAKKCLISDLDYSRGCIYRKQLESNNIFYGKNASEYKPEIYDDYKRRYEALSESEQNTLCELLHYFFVEKAGTYRVMLPDQLTFPTLERAGFIRLASYPEKIVKGCTIDAMIKACGNRIFEANEWEKGNCVPEKWNTRRNRIINENGRVQIYKTELCQWILEFSPETVEALTKGIHFVEIDIETFRELYELFRDYMYQENYTSTLNTCENDHRFLAST